MYNIIRGSSLIDGWFTSAPNTLNTIYLAWNSTTVEQSFSVVWNLSVTPLDRSRLFPERFPSWSLCLDFYDIFALKISCPILLPPNLEFTIQRDFLERTSFHSCPFTFSRNRAIQNTDCCLLEKWGFFRLMEFRYFSLSRNVVPVIVLLEISRHRYLYHRSIKVNLKIFVLLIKFWLSIVNFQNFFFFRIRENMWEYVWFMFALLLSSKINNVRINYNLYIL